MLFCGYYICLNYADDLSKENAGLAPQAVVLFFKDLCAVKIRQFILLQKQLTLWHTYTYDIHAYFFLEKLRMRRTQLCFKRLYLKIVTDSCHLFTVFSLLSFLL